MEVTVEMAILVAGVLLFAGAVASRMSDALGVPAMLLFLGLGMLAGSEGLGGALRSNPTKSRRPSAPWHWW